MREASRNHVQETPDDPADPRPTPPPQPALEECCGSGCDPCIYDLYSDALDRYREALAEWEARHRAPRPTPHARR